MALVLTITDQTYDIPEGNELFKSKVKTTVRGTMAWDNSYPTGGEAVDALLTTAGYMATIDSIQVSPAAGYVFSYDKANGKILAYISDDAVDPLDQVADTTDLSALTAVAFEARGNKVGTGVGSVA